MIMILISMKMTAITIINDNGIKDYNNDDNEKNSYYNVME